MKRSVLFGIVTLAAIATSHASIGDIYILNYQGAYNPVYWINGPRAGLPVLSTEGVTLTLYWAKGNNLSPGQLTHSASATWNVFSEQYGYPGYYQVEAKLLDWLPGDTYTFQMRADQPFLIRSSVTWTENTDIRDISGIPPGPPGLSMKSIGFGIGAPEPSTFALVGLGFAGLAFLRRRS